MDTVRRKTIGALAACLALPASAIAQQLGRPRTRRVTVCDRSLRLVGDPVARRRLWVNAFAKHGWVDGENLALTVRHGNALDPAVSKEADDLAREVVASRPDVIVVANTWLARIHRRTRDIPIVFVGMADPEYHGYLQTMRRPGSNVTGVRDAFFEMQEKRLAWLKEMRPEARRMALVQMPGPYDDRIRAQLTAIGSRLGMDPTMIAASIDVRHDVLAQELRKARIDVADFSIPASIDIANMLVQLRVPASFSNPGSVSNGGLLSYSHTGMMQIAVDLAVRILRGERVETLPAQQPTEFHLAVNLRTARALGITVSESILVSANEVID